MLFGRRIRRAVFCVAALVMAGTSGFGQQTAPQPALQTAPQSTAQTAEAPERDSRPAGDSRVVVVGAIEGAIGPATVRHVERLVEAAADLGQGRQAEALVLRLDTPGGLTDSTRRIVAAILGSAVPVIGWVGPPGAHAASAGTYILYATHVAAMAPATNLGAATPVQIGGAPGTPPPGTPEPGGDGRPVDGQPGDGQPDDGATDRGGDGSAPDRTPLSGGDAMSAKMSNDAVAWIRSLAELRGRNADWAEKSVREAASLSVDAALAEGVVDLVASDVERLLAEADGREVTVLGRERVLDTAAARTVAVDPGAITRLLGVLSNPNIALVLMLIGIYGIIFEFMSPGMVGPGVIGAIALTLGLYSLNQLPLDYAGLALIGLGVAFMVAEAMAPSFGVLGLGGLVAFVLGSAMLIDTDVPEYQISWWLIAGMAAASFAVLVLLLGISWRAYRRAPDSTMPMVEAVAEVVDWSGGAGHVVTQGERWRAVGPADLSAGERVRIGAVDGLTLTVMRGRASYRAPVGAHDRADGRANGPADGPADGRADPAAGEER